LPTSEIPMPCLLGSISHTACCSSKRANRYQTELEGVLARLTSGFKPRVPTQMRDKGPSVDSPRPEDFILYR
jgi:hypothetical protein